MSFNPLVSVVVPVFNGENFLREAVDSALAQTYGNIEVLVVNDGSADGTDAVCRSYGDRIRYFRKENGGVASALNLGIRAMRGEYFAWLSHDDAFYLNKIELQIGALASRRDRTGPVHGRADYVDLLNRRFVVSTANDRHDPSNLANGVYPLLFSLVNGSTLLLHKSAFEALGLFDESLPTTQDYDFWFKAFRNKSTVYLDFPLIRCRWHPEQGSRAIPTHLREADALHLGFLDSLSESEGEIASMFGSRYNFYFAMYIHHLATGLANCRRRYAELFLKEPESPAAALPAFTNEAGETKIALLGAGCRGRELWRELQLRGFGNMSFFDNFAAGIARPDESLREYFVIVTPEDLNGALRSQVISLGCRRWSAFAQVMPLLAKIPPLKRLAADFIEREGAA